MKNHVKRFKCPCEFFAFGKNAFATAFVAKGNTPTTQALFGWAIISI